MKRKILAMILCAVTTVAMFVMPAGAQVFAAIPSEFFVTDSDYPFVSDADYYPENYTGYHYPMRPGTEQWLTLEDFDRMIEVCQIPQKILKNLSTEELAQTVLSYPLIIELFLYDSPELAFYSVYSKFNALNELISRENSHVILAKRYMDQDFVRLENSIITVSQTSRSSAHPEGSIVSQKKIAGQILRDNSLEFLLLQPIFFNKFSKSVASHLINTIKLRKEEQKELFSSLSRSSSFDGIQAATTYSTMTWDGHDVQYNSIQATASDVLVPAYDVINELTTAQKNWYNFEMKLLNLSATRMTDPSLKYNCHSYAWYKSSSPKYLMNYDPSFATKKYTEITKEPSKMIANKTRVIYIEDEKVTHSGIITEINSNDIMKSTVRSKWGPAGEYTHQINKGSYYKSGVTCKLYNPK